MMYLYQNNPTATQRRLPLFLVNDIDGKTPMTGLTFATSDILIGKNGAAEVNSAGTVTELGNGLYYYTMTQSETDTLGFITVHLAKAGVRTFISLHQIIAVNPFDNTWGILDAPATIDTFTLRNIFRYMAAILFGKVSGGPASPIFKSADGSTTRVTATADSNGNRSSITLS